MARKPSGTSARKYAESTTRRDVMGYKARGFENVEIADILGISRQRVHLIVKEEMATNAAETAGYVEGMNGERMEAMGRLRFVARKLMERIEKGIEEVIHDDEGREVARLTKPDDMAYKLYREYERDMAEIGGYMAPKAVDLTNNGGRFEAGGTVVMLPMNDDPDVWEAQAAQVLNAGEAAAAALENGTNEAASG